MEKVRVTVTIPKNIYNALYEQAKRDMRTVSNQLTYILEQRLINPTPTFVKSENQDIIKRKEIL